MIHTNIHQIVIVYCKYESNLITLSHQTQKHRICCSFLFRSWSSNVYCSLGLSTVDYHILNRRKTTINQSSCLHSPFSSNLDFINSAGSFN